MNLKKVSVMVGLMCVSIGLVGVSFSESLDVSIDPDVDEVGGGAGGEVISGGGTGGVGGVGSLGTIEPLPGGGSYESRGVLRGGTAFYENANERMYIDTNGTETSFDVGANGKRAFTQHQDLTESNVNVSGTGGDPILMGGDMQ